MASLLMAIQAVETATSSASESACQHFRALWAWRSSRLSYRQWRSCISQKTMPFIVQGKSEWKRRVEFKLGELRLECEKNIRAAARAQKRKRDRMTNILTKRRTLPKHSSGFDLFSLSSREMWPIQTIGVFWCWASLRPKLTINWRDLMSTLVWNQVLDVGSVLAGNTARHQIFKKMLCCWEFSPVEMF